MSQDNISPDHYKNGPFECIKLSSKYSFCYGNAIKYVWRHNDKGKPIEDLEKAIWYLDYAMKSGEILTPVLNIYSRDTVELRPKLNMLIDLDFAGAKEFWFALLQGDKLRALSAVQRMIDDKRREEAE